MSEIKYSNYLYGFILFTLVLTSGVYLLGQYHLDNPAMQGQAQYQQFNKTFNKATQLSSELGKLQGNIEDTNSSSGFFASKFGFIDSLMSKAWNSLKLMGTSFSFVGDTINGLSDFFGLPAWLTSILGLLLIVLFIFTIWGAIFQKDL